MGTGMVAPLLEGLAEAANTRPGPTSPSEQEMNHGARPASRATPVFTCTLIIFSTIIMIITTITTTTTSTPPHAPRAARADHHDQYHHERQREARTDSVYSYVQSTVRRVVTRVQCATVRYGGRGRLFFR